MLSFHAVYALHFSAKTITFLSSKRLGGFILAPLTNSLLSGDRRMTDWGYLFTDFAAGTAGVIEDFGVRIGLGFAFRLGRRLLIDG